MVKFCCLLQRGIKQRQYSTICLFPQLLLFGGTKQWSCHLYLCHTGLLYAVVLSDSVLGSTYACSRVIHHCPTKEQTLHMLFVFAHLPIEQMPYCCSKVALLACGKNVCHMYAVANESNSILRLFSYLQSYTYTKVK